MPTTTFDPYGAGNAGRSSFKRYIAALLVVGLATAAHLLAAPVFREKFLFSILALAAMGTAWYGGLGPSILTATLAIILSAFWARSWVSLAAFVSVMAGIILLAESYRQRLKHASDTIALHKRAEEKLHSTAASLRSENECLRKHEEQSIRDRKSVEQRLQESEDRMEVAQAAAPFIIFHWNLNEQLLLLGDSRSIFGIDNIQMRAHESWLDRIHPEDRGTTDREVARAIEERTPLDIEFRVTWPEGDVH